ncbi:phenylalanine--tRNA ligase subunit alpha [bacterium]|jgi:phenylalanyl-tRNA synthetase alpha chain|nr:phenylalanine--tRNA ligase subunit alpha [bacterium]MBT4249186.1 phenylalanine--tRNA ligase subunit alpha [bacterium]MBT4928198.1 phenylalanine--tRNA ligase subunit alpha [bacterium]MBT5735040.1 phenylalanine--tRNA ligase subunit alpha [bacterium]MBT6018567.1 phenylalanine--tRNA ligase subunit alpha [bacterium]
MSLKDSIESVKNDFLTDFATVSDSSGTDMLKQKYLSRNGLVTNLFKQLGQVSKEDKPLFGQLLNQLKIDLNDKLSTLDNNSNSVSDADKIDIFMPEKTYSAGSIHILEQTMLDIKKIFSEIGFNVAYGPEIDDDYHNFSALNVPEHHPARDMQDTFFVDKDIVLRTHTSNVQIHLMEEEEPPLRFIVPGRVYRNEAISYKSYCLFHQVEGLFVDKNVSFSQLKGCLEYFAKKMFGANRKMRWRPSYFPFTEPSAEVDIWDEQRNQWMEILGCGMVDPEVFKSVGYDTNVWRGYAFGMGVERIAMLKHDIDDIRLFYNGDVRFLRQF